jgi:hypothetical protein
MKIASTKQSSLNVDQSSRFVLPTYNSICGTVHERAYEYIVPVIDCFQSCSFSAKVCYPRLPAEHLRLTYFSTVISRGAVDISIESGIRDVPDSSYHSCSSKDSHSIILSIGTALHSHITPPSIYHIRHHDGISTTRYPARGESCHCDRCVR